MNKRIILSLFSCIFLSSCAVVAVGAVGKGAYNMATDERSIGEQGNDLNTKWSVKSALTQKKFKNISNIAVYCYDSVVYLIGEADEKTGKEAVATAYGVQNVKSVKTKWFKPGTGNSIDDTALLTKLSGKLTVTKHVSSTNLSLEVYGGNVVLLGILSSTDEINRAVKAIKETDGVKSVTNFVIYK